MEIHWIFTVIVVQVALRTAVGGLDRGDFKDAFDIVEMEEKKNIEHEGEEMRIIEDPDELYIIKLKQQATDENGDVREEFLPLPIPSDFDSYDVDRDGFISLIELITVTGAKENSQQAFNDSDTNNDGLINIDEFLLAPWSLNVDDFGEGFADDTIHDLAGSDKGKLDDTLNIGNKFIRDDINDVVTLEKRILLDDEEYEQDDYDDEYEYEYEEDEMETDQEDMDDEKYKAWFQ